MEAFRFEMGVENRRLLRDPASRGIIKGEMLYAVRSKLTKKQRETFLLYYGKKLKMPEIARKQGVCVSTVSRSISRARRRIDRHVCAVMEGMIPKRRG